MFSIVTDSQLALDGNYDRACYLRHVGTEGPKVRDPEEALAQDGWRYATGDEYEAAKHRALHSNRQLAERMSIGCP
jgi:hypothetical protein